jgi:hypothetical protein
MLKNAHYAEYAGIEFSFNLLMNRGTKRKDKRVNLESI